MLIIFHKSLMALATLCLITGVSAAVFFRKNRYWLKIHKAFNSSAAFFMSAGASMAIAAVWQQKGDHLDGLHPVNGSIAIGLTIISLIIGFYSFKAKKRIPVFKTIHRWAGRLSLLLLIVALITGLMRAGVI
ncbi:MAG: hypothetical protein CVU52_06890 [Deltaproteobacteria bacterium HGW-Deltaproteobacteria-10]|nr:MAG: hypothetical protein CVU52_06890 [Deltaproteobacteria bacterium HGW-Deltaproteobacteria-10]